LSIVVLVAWANDVAAQPWTVVARTWPMLHSIVRSRPDPVPACPGPHSCRSLHILQNSTPTSQAIPKCVVGVTQNVWFHREALQWFCQRWENVGSGREDTLDGRDRAKPCNLVAALHRMDAPRHNAAALCCGTVPQRSLAAQRCAVHCAAFRFRASATV
jgi:hypothetical protein